MRIGILGAGLSGLSLAYFLERNSSVSRIELIEKEKTTGGLCRSFSIEGFPYDIGPHIIFSKDQETLGLMTGLLGDNIVKIRRSNKILYKGRLVKYPFENELSALPDEDKRYCLHSFIHNPYERYKPETMLQFFLATFGEGITNCYLRPYNEKIWKFDPAFMGTQMVERIPKPPPEDIIKSAEGVPTEGYTHQLYFHYPREGGIASLVRSLQEEFGPKTAIRLDAAVSRVEREQRGWKIVDSRGTESVHERLVSTIPLPELARVLAPALPAGVGEAIGGLRYNSIILCAMKFSKDRIGDNFAVMVPDKEALFHRVSKLDFLKGDGAAGSEGSTVLAEITFRPGDLIGAMTDEDIRSRVLEDLVRVGFIEREAECLAAQVRRFPYAYVIYDLDHRRNMKTIREYLEGELGLVLCGRFGEFEYLNMDAVISNARGKAALVAGEA